MRAAHSNADQRAHSSSPAQRAETACLFMRDLVVMLLLIAAGVWALLTWLEPCPAATLCSVAFIRRPYAGRGPRWWQRLVLRLRARRLAARAANQQYNIEFLQHELALIRQLLDALQAGAEETKTALAWTRSDLANLS